MNAAKLLNDENIRSRFSYLMYELSRHPDLKINKGFDEWWGYNELSGYTWAVLETPDHLDGILCAYIEKGTYSHPRYLLTDDEGEEHVFWDYDGMLRNGRCCGKCGCGPCSCFKPPVKPSYNRTFLNSTAEICALVGLNKSSPPVADEKKIICSGCSTDCTAGIEDIDYFELEEEDGGKPFTYCSKCWAVVLKEQIELYGN